MRIAKDQHTIHPSFLPSFLLLFLFLSHVFNHPPKSRHFRPSWSTAGSILLSLSFFLHDHFYRANRSTKPSIHHRVIVIDRDSRMLFSIRMHRSLSRERERERKEGKGETQGRRGEGRNRKKERKAENKKRGGGEKRERQT